MYLLSLFFVSIFIFCLIIIYIAIGECWSKAQVELGELIYLGVSYDDLLCGSLSPWE